MPQTTVQKSHWTDDSGISRTQYSMTIPKNLAEALGLEQGDSIEWKIESGNSLRVTKVNE